MTMFILRPCNYLNFPVSSNLLSRLAFFLKDGFSPLMSASEGGQIELVQVLVDEGADPNLRGQVGTV